MTRSTRFPVARLSVLLSLALAATAKQAEAQSTAFTYQGRLRNAGAPVTAPCDFQFKLFDAANAGNQKGSTLIFDGQPGNPPSVAVTGGLFTAELDFGLTVFDGGDRYLEISVRQPAGMGQYITLATRQKLTNAPSANVARQLAMPLDQLVSLPGTAFRVSNIGVSIEGFSQNGPGVQGYGVAGIGLYGRNSIGSLIANLGTSHGVWGDSFVGNGVLGTSGSGAGVRGVSNGGINKGVVGVADAAGAVGVEGTSAAGNGVSGQSTNQIGVVGVSANYLGVSGQGPTYGVYGLSIGGIGVQGASTSSYGVRGDSTSFPGVTGVSNTNYGVQGVSTSNIGVHGSSTNNIGVLGQTSNASSYAGYFSGRVHVNGLLSKNGGSFKIDHPLDPANKYLSHSFVESPDMKNIYDGVARLDANGEAWVTLPDWFEALNRDFRYGLTCIESFAPVFIKQRVKDNRFLIAGGQPGMEVSWQVTGIRKDAWAEAHRIPVEEDKPADERGKYLTPLEHGQPEELMIGPALPAIEPMPSPSNAAAQPDLAQQ